MSDKLTSASSSFDSESSCNYYENTYNKKRKNKKQLDYYQFIKEEKEIFEFINEDALKFYNDNENCYDENYFKVMAKNKQQEEYIKSLNNNEYPIVFAIGVAGTGKTLISCNYAITKLLNDEYDKLVITRPIVSVDEEHGYLPGDIHKKMDPWLKPLYDIFLKSVSSYHLKKMIMDEIIEICPFAYMRGRTFENCIIVADEMQNSTENQMKMLLTRIGNGSKLIINGDNMQSDNKKENGLKHFINLYKNIEKYKKINELSKIKIIEFNAYDVQRHPIISTILQIYEK